MSLTLLKKDLLPLKAHSEKPLKWRYIPDQHDSTQETKSDLHGK